MSINVYKNEYALNGSFVELNLMIADLLEKKQAEKKRTCLWLTKHN